MRGRWRKLGLVYAPQGGARHARLLTHTANPLPIHLGDDVFRVFYSGRGADNRSSVGAVDIDLIARRVVHDHREPFFEPGPEGTFFADGVSIGNCYEAEGRRYILFMGWQRPRGGHWRGSIGRLVLGPDLSLALDGDTPFMASDDDDPVSLSYPWVLRNRDGRYRMWYGSTVCWDAGNGEMLHVIKSASSDDGHNWRREGLAVPYALGTAQAFSRPAVAVNEGGDYEMWFSYRGAGGEKYRIGHAASPDGVHWERSVGGSDIDVSPNGWDSEMIEYPFVLDHRGKRYLLYNGNDYGGTGFGIAVREHG